MSKVDYTVYCGSKSGDIVEQKKTRELGPFEAIVELTHSGVCGTDEHYRHADQGLGHEGVGIVKQLGAHAARISDLRVGERVGLGWAQKYCGHCEDCLKGRTFTCQHGEEFGNANLDTGCFGSALARDASWLVKIPDAIPSEYAGPLTCGGATVWGPLYEHGLRAGDRVGVVGVGGLGHLAIQFGKAMGMEMVVFSRTDSKREEAMKFGAAEFHATQDVKEFTGVAKLDHLLVTTSMLPDFALFFPILNHAAKIFPLTISTDNAAIPMLPFTVQNLQLVGSTGAQKASVDRMMAFAAAHGVRPQIEKFPMTQRGVTDAMAKLREGKMRYRGVVVREDLM